MCALAQTRGYGGFADADVENLERELVGHSIIGTLGAVSIWRKYKKLVKGGAEGGTATVARAAMVRGPVTVLVSSWLSLAWFRTRTYMSDTPMGDAERERRAVQFDRLNRFLAMPLRHFFGWAVNVPPIVDPRIVNKMVTEHYDSELRKRMAKMSAEELAAEKKRIYHTPMQVIREPEKSERKHEYYRVRKQVSEIYARHKGWL